MKFVRMNGENTAVFEIEVPVHEIDLKVDLGLPPSKNRIAAFDSRARTNGVVSDEEWDELELAGANVPFFSNRRNPLSPEEATLALSILEASMNDLKNHALFLTTAKALKRAHLSAAELCRYEDAVVKFANLAVDAMLEISNRQ